MADALEAGDGMCPVDDDQFPDASMRRIIDCAQRSSMKCDPRIIRIPFHLSDSLQVGLYRCTPGSSPYNLNE
ncbi:hypothetical protein Dda_0528 [Drechslerella dactyloides]|uniref:Uncharacterized protein n=1 Tax=Drechslerella dactyloides TaxID=74499 RepID=A0AAD6NN32_DREDA|nr:hypothetical protein Dda_0528 [Drechslerella dactyloides]